MNAISVNPARITERIFGGPHFMAGWADQTFFYSHDRKRRWRWADIYRCWMEGRNCPPAPTEGGE